MDLKDKIKSILSSYQLLDHPFYRDWTAGTLSTESLRTYAREYGTFIATIPEGWQNAGYPSIADVEKLHVEYWNMFTRSLGERPVEKPEIMEVKVLLKEIQELFNDQNTALGALLSFEYQQPEISLSKLNGLKKNYSQINPDTTYFEAHLNDWEEPELLLDRIEKLATDSQEEALNAVELSVRLLWNALSGIHAS